jgi:hypothetical protein
MTSRRLGERIKDKALQGQWFSFDLEEGLMEQEQHYRCSAVLP